MGQTNQNGEPVSNMERLKEEALACGPGCSCRAGGASGRARWAVGVIVLVIAAVLVVRAVTRADGQSGQVGAAAFAAPAAAAATLDASATEVPEAKPAVCGELIQSLADLNTRAVDRDAVFIFLAGKDTANARAAGAVVEKAATTIRSQGIRMGLFTLADDSSQYASFAVQAPPPSVIAIAKGRGASVVTGDITESKLVQAFVAAANAGGSCCPSGTPSANCN